MHDKLFEYQERKRWLKDKAKECYPKLKKNNGKIVTAPVKISIIEV